MPPRIGYKALTCFTLCAITINCFAATAQTIKVKPTVLAQTYTSQGTIVARYDVMISSQQSGIINHIYFSNGQTIQKGAPLFSLKSVVLGAQLKQSQAKEHLDQLIYQRRHTLKQQNAGISQQKLDKALADLKEAKSQVDYYQAQIAQRTITAPFAGKVGKSLVSLGQFIQAGTPLVRLLSNQDLKADYTLPASYRSQVKQGQTVWINNIKSNQPAIKAKTTYISPFVDKSSRTIDLQASLIHAGSVVPGQFVNVLQVINAKRKVLIIPSKAILTGLQGQYVLQVINGKAVVTFIKTQSLGDRAIVTHGLKNNAIIIVSGQEGLKTGDSVTSRPAASAP